MATATKNRVSKAKTEAETNGHADNGNEVRLKAPPLIKHQMIMRIKGTSPMIQHKFSEKARIALREIHAGKKTKNRDVRNPEQEGKDAAYRLEDGRYGFPAGAMMKCMINAAHKDIGIDKVLVRKALRVLCDNNLNLIVMECDEMEIREDRVRLKGNKTDLRYRPYFYNWKAVVVFEMDSEWMGPQDVINLVERAGFGVGLMEWRPEKGGEFGTFTIDKEFGIDVKTIDPVTI